MDKYHFKNALEKGHGRAVQYTRRVSSLVDEGFAMHACLENLACDWQIEGTRALWMVGILDEGNALPRLAQPLMQRAVFSSDVDDEDDLRTRRPRGNRRDQRGRLSGPRSAQRSELILEFVRRGYEGAREALDALLPRVDTPSCICEGLARLDGEKGLVHVASLLSDLEDESLDIGVEVLDAADRALGENNALHLLRRNATTNPSVRWLLRQHKRETKKMKAYRKSWREKNLSIRPRSGKHAIRALRKSSGYPTWFLQWASRRANSSDLEYVLDCAKNEPNFVMLRYLLRALEWADYQRAVPWILTFAVYPIFRTKNGSI